MSMKLTLPNGLELADGTVVKLRRFSGVLWVVRFGWYTYSNRQFKGWYFSAIPNQSVLPVNPTDLNGITAVSGKLLDTKPEVPPDISKVPAPPPQPPTPINPEYVPAFISKADKALYDAAFISVADLVALRALCMHKLPDGKIVRVNDAGDQKPAYFIWSAATSEWIPFEFTPSIELVPNEKLLHIDANKLGSTLSITTEKIDDVLYIVLKGVGGVEVSKVDASQFIGTSSLVSVQMEDRVIDGVTHKFLVMTYELEDGELATVECDLSDVLQAYTAEVDGGLKLSNYAFSIDNEVEACSQLNTDQTLQFGQSISLNSVQYDKHGLVVGNKSFSIQMPSLTGSVGSLEFDKLLIYATVDNSGSISGQTIDISRTVNDASTHHQIPTAKAVNIRADDATSKWYSY